MATEHNRQPTIDGPKFPMQFAAPIYFGVPSEANSKINNGTITLIKFRGHKFGITNHHVIYKYKIRNRSEKGLSLNIGNFRVNDLNEITIHEDKEADLFVMDLNHASEDDLESGDEVPTFFLKSMTSLAHQFSSMT